MAIVEVKLAFSAQTGNDKLYLRRRSYEQKWLVRTDNAADGPALVKNDPRVPQYGSYYQTGTEYDSFARLRERDCEQVSPDSNLLWVVTCRFDTMADNGAGDTLLPPPQPYDDPPIAEWDAHEDKEPAYFCYGDNEEQLPITNSALDFYDPPPERIVTAQIFKVQRNLSDFNPVQWALYSNAVNSDSWYGFAPGMVLFKPPKAKLVAQRGFGYWQTQFEFHINYRGWFHYMWDAGMREYLPPDNGAAVGRRNDGKKVGYNHLKNEDGTFVTHPVLLNGNGRRLVQPGIAALNTVLREAVLFKFRVQHKLPFGPLQII